MDETQSPVQFCPDCAAQMPVGARFCPGCGRSMQPTARAQGKVGALPENVAGALSYFTLLPALIFLFVEPYRKSIFIRFHSLQCLMISGAGVLIVIVLRLAGLAFFLIPVVGPLLVVCIDVLCGLAALFVWLVLVVKALQGEIFKLSFVGDLAERYASRP